MKKVLSLILAAVMLVGIVTLSGCAKKESTAESAPSQAELPLTATLLKTAQKSPLRKSTLSMSLTSTSSSSLKTTSTPPKRQ